MKWESPIFSLMEKEAYTIHQVFLYLRNENNEGFDVFPNNIGVNI